MSWGIALGIGASVIGGLFGSSASKKAAKQQFEAQKRAAELMAGANRKIAQSELDFSKRQAEATYDTGLRSLNVETAGSVDAWRLDKRALANERRRLGLSYAQQTESMVSLGTKEIEFSVSQALDEYDARVGFINKEMAARRAEADRQAAEVERQVRDKKSDAAIEADRAMATARVAAGERGAAGTNTYVRLMNEGEYFKGVSVDRIEKQGEYALGDLEADLQFAAIQAESEVRSAELALQGAGKEAALFAERLSTELQQLALQQYLDFEAVDLQDEALDTEYRNLQDRYNLAKSILGEQLTLSTDLSQQVFDNANIQIDAQEEAMIAGALATKNAQVSLANTSFLTGLISSGVNLFGDYYSRSTQASAYSRVSGTPIDTARGLYGLW